MGAGGIMSDVFGSLSMRGTFGSQLAGPTTAYVFVYGIEVLMLAGTVALMYTLVGSSLRNGTRVRRSTGGRAPEGCSLTLKV